MSKLKDIIAKVEAQNIILHPAAKNAYTPTDLEQADLEKFQELYDDYWINHGETRTTEADGFHPSHLGVTHGNCSRRAVYLLRGEAKEQVFDARTKRVFQNGHDVHNRVQEAISKLPGVEFEAEVAVLGEDPTIRGHADGRIVLTWNERKILLEIKSCNEGVFVARQKWKQPKPEHFAQANIYAFLLGIDDIWFYYECKNSQNYIMFEQKMDSLAATKQLNKWRKAQAVFNDGKLPVRPYKQESKACSYCDLRTKCWSDEEVGI